MWGQQKSNRDVKQESTPLVSSSNNGGGGGDDTGAVSGTPSTSQHNYYFLNRANSERAVEVVEEIPEGSTKDEFAPKVLLPVESPAPSKRNQPSGAPAGPSANKNNNNTSGNRNPGGGGFWSNWFGGGGGVGNPSSGASLRKPSATPMDNGVGTMLKLRKAPIKIEPKVFFANERTFLAWMHLSVTLAGASIAILAFAEDANPVSQLYGVLLLPVAIAFILYSMYQYARRAYMIRNRHPGPYEDTVGPAFLGIMLMVSIVAQFALKLYTMAS